MLKKYNMQFNGITSTIISQLSKIEILTHIKCENNQFAAVRNDKHQSTCSVD